MKSISLVIFCFAFLSLKAQNCIIPDIAFKSYLLANAAINTDADKAEISLAEAAAFTGKIDVSQKQISSLDGIEYFTNLTGLNCQQNLLTFLGLSKNIALKELNCTGNQLVELNLVFNAQLTNLICGGNKLAKLDISNNTLLTNLICPFNELTFLDVTRNSALVAIDCGSNSISTLDLSKNNELTVLGCNNNLLTGLNVSHLGELQLLYCHNNPNLKIICVKSENIAASHPQFKKDASAIWSETCSPVVDEFVIPDPIFKEYLLSHPGINTDHDNQISLAEAAAYTGSILVSQKGIKSLAGIEAFTNITQLECFGNELTSLDLTKNTKLVHLKCSNNQLSQLDISQNPLLVTLDCSTNNLTSLNLQHQTGLTSLKCSVNKLSNLYVKNQPGLKELDVYYNKLTALDVTENRALTKLVVSHNPITTLNISNNILLTKLECSNTSLTSLDVTKNLELSALDCSDNKLTALDVSQNPEMRDLRATGNPLLSTICVISEYNVTHYLYVKDPAAVWSTTCSTFPGDRNVHIPDPVFKSLLLSLESLNTDADKAEISYAEAGKWEGGLDIDHNGISLIGLEAFTKLRYLFCRRISLSSLDLSKNVGLQYLDCGYNQISDLDLSKNVNLVSLTCAGNKIKVLNVSKNTMLKDINCEAGTLKQLIFSSQNKSLQAVNCNFNQLEHLDVSECSALKGLSCEGNQLTFLDVSKNDSLSELDCTQNPFLPMVCVKSVQDATENPKFMKDEDAIWSEDCKLATGINGKMVQETERIYPNPVADILYVGKDVSLVQIRNLQGILILEATSSKVDVATLREGMYTIQVRYATGQVVSEKFVKH